METRTGVAEVNGTRLYFDLAGSGPPLVLIHGFGLDTRMWDDQMAAFAASHRVIRYDLRGFGQSPPPSAPYAHADDLKALLDYLGIGQAVIVGLSFGGGIAIDFALAYPEATAALIPVDSILGGYRFTPVFDASLGAVYETGRRAGVEAARAQWLAHPLFEAVREQPAVGTRFVQLVTAYSGWHWVNQDPVWYPDPPALDRLGEIAAPTLVVVGEREVPDFRGIADELERLVPGARKVVLPGVGHMANMEDPAQFNDVALRFLAGVRAPGARLGDRAQSGGRGAVSCARCMRPISSFGAIGSPVDGESRDLP